MLEHAAKNPSPSLITVGNAHIVLGNHEEALGYMLRAVEANPDSLIEVLSLASVLGYLGQTDKVKQVFDGIFASAPDYSIVQYQNSMRRYWGNAPETIDLLISGLVQTCEKIKHRCIGPQAKGNQNPAFQK